MIKAQICIALLLNLLTTSCRSWTASSDAPRARAEAPKPRSLASAGELAAEAKAIALDLQASFAKYQSMRSPQPPSAKWPRLAAAMATISPQDLAQLLADPGLERTQAKLTAQRSGRGLALTSAPFADLQPDPSTIAAGSLATLSLVLGFASYGTTMMAQYRLAQYEAMQKKIGTIDGADARMQVIADQFGPERFAVYQSVRLDVQNDLAARDMEDDDITRRIDANDDDLGRFMDYQVKLKLQERLTTEADPLQKKALQDILAKHELLSASDRPVYENRVRAGQVVRIVAVTALIAGAALLAANQLRLAQPTTPEAALVRSLETTIAPRFANLRQKVQKSLPSSQR